ncbi:MAG TPA: hypothetical protein V6C81_24340 [Planktothrix sp.]
MKTRNAILAAIGASCGLFIGALTQLYFRTPWEQPIFLAAVIYFVIAGAYGAVSAGVVRDILGSKGSWANSKFRMLGVPIFGATTGLVFLAWLCLFFPEGIKSFQAADLTNIWSVPEAIRFLVPKAYLLAAAKMFVDYADQFAGIFAALFALAIGFHDTIRPKWYVTTTAVGLVLPVPLFVANAITTHQTIRDFFDYGFLPFIAISITGGMLCAAVAAIVGSIRGGWWLPSTGAWYAERAKEQRKIHETK